MGDSNGFVATDEKTILNFLDARIAAINFFHVGLDKPRNYL